MSWQVLNEYLKKEAKAVGKNILEDVTYISHLKKSVQDVGKSAVCKAIASTLAFLSSNQPTIGERAYMSQEAQAQASKRFREELESYKRTLGC